jgi:hypothetical protein
MPTANTADHTPARGSAARHHDARSAPGDVDEPSDAPIDDLPQIRTVSWGGLIAAALAQHQDLPLETTGGPTAVDVSQ